MLPRFPAVTRYLSLAALCVAGPVAALELPLPPPGEDIIGQVQVIKAKYEDTFADLGTTYDLGYSEMVAANPGVAYFSSQRPVKFETASCPGLGTTG